MPGRWIREGILTSDRVDKLTPECELFYRRMLSVADDFGRFDARPVVLRVSCYPLRVDQVTPEQVITWLGECEAAGLLGLYGVNGSHLQAKWIHAGALPEILGEGRVKPFLQLHDFRQKIRRKGSKWPAPPGVIDPDDDPCGPGAPHLSDGCETHVPQEPATCGGKARRMCTESVVRWTMAIDGKTGGTVDEKDPPPAAGVQTSSRPPARRAESPRRGRYAGKAEPSPDRLDADYSRVCIPDVETPDDVYGISGDDPIVLAMAVSRDQEERSWRGWVRLLSDGRKRLGRERADTLWRTECEQFFSELHAGETVHNRGASLTSRLKEALNGGAS